MSFFLPRWIFQRPAQDDEIAGSGLPVPGQDAASQVRISNLFAEIFGPKPGRYPAPALKGVLDTSAIPDGSTGILGHMMRQGQASGNGNTPYTGHGARGGLLGGPAAPDVTGEPEGFTKFLTEDRYAQGAPTFPTLPSPAVARLPLAAGSWAQGNALRGQAQLDPALRRASEDDLLRQAQVDTAWLRSQGLIRDEGAPLTHPLSRTPLSGLPRLTPLPMRQMAAAQAPQLPRLPQAPQQPQAIQQPGRTPPQNPFRIHWDFIEQQEGSRLDGYIPIDGNKQIIGQSGVTIGRGVDLGQWTLNGLANIISDQNLLNKLAPYLGLRRQAADAYLSAHPLMLTQQEADALGQAVGNEIIRDLASRYDRAQNFTQFSDLPSDVQTAIADVAFQHGPNLAVRAPKFWAAITRGDWDGAYSELQNFGDRHPTRRRADADRLAFGMLGGNVPHP